MPYVPLSQPSPQFMFYIPLSTHAPRYSTSLCPIRIPHFLKQIEVTKEEKAAVLAVGEKGIAPKAPRKPKAPRSKGNTKTN